MQRVRCTRVFDGCGSGQSIELIARRRRQPRNPPREHDVTAEFDTAGEQGHESGRDREPPSLSTTEPCQESCEQRDHRLQQEKEVSADRVRLPSLDESQQVRVRIGCCDELCKPAECHQSCGGQEDAKQESHHFSRPKGWRSTTTEPGITTSWKTLARVAP